VFGLTKVKALAHLRYYFPPAGMIRTAATGPIDPRIPIAASRIWLLAPHHELKVSEARMLGKLFFQLQVERDDVDQGTCHECPDGCYGFRMGRHQKRYYFCRAFGISAEPNHASAAYLRRVPHIAARD
jgi:hypothetical protein